MFKQKVLKKYQINAFQIEIEKDEGDIKFVATEDGEEAGSLTIAVQYLDSEKSEHSFPFGPYSEEPFFDDISKHEYVINIEDLSVEKEYQKKGVASELMKRGMAEIKSRYPNVPVYINASPYGGKSNISLEALITFYKKFGFKVLTKYSEHRNALLWRDKA